MAGIARTNCVRCDASCFFVCRIGNDWVCVERFGAHVALVADAVPVTSGAAEDDEAIDGHYRYDSDEFDYSGCSLCDSNGDTLGWPCPTVRAHFDTPLADSGRGVHEAFVLPKDGD